MGKYVIVTWPNSQDLMNKPGFRANSYLVNDDKGIEDFGSSAYFVDEDWLNNAENKPNDTERARYCEQTYFFIKSVFEDGEIADIDNPFYLSDGSTAVGFMLDEGNEDIMVITTDDSNSGKPVKKIKESDRRYVSFFGLPLEDRDEIARMIDDDEYTVQ